jgi:hypothetical protein
MSSSPARPRITVPSSRRSSMISSPGLGIRRAGYEIDRIGRGTATFEEVELAG